MTDMFTAMSQAAEDLLNMKTCFYAVKDARRRATLDYSLRSDSSKSADDGCPGTRT